MAKKPVTKEPKPKTTSKAPESEALNASGIGAELGKLGDALSVQATEQATEVLNAVNASKVSTEAGFSKLEKAVGPGFKSVGSGLKSVQKKLDKLSEDLSEEETEEAKPEKSSKGSSGFWFIPGLVIGLSVGLFGGFTYKAETTSTASMSEETLAEVKELKSLLKEHLPAKDKVASRGTGAPKAGVVATYCPGKKGKKSRNVTLWGWQGDVKTQVCELNDDGCYDCMQLQRRVPPCEFNEFSCSQVVDKKVKATTKAFCTESLEKDLDPEDLPAECQQ